jgi:penicillin-binding protein 1C
VVTTLDAGMQRLVLEALGQQLRELADRNVRDGAAIVVDNASGEVLAYVGSAGPYSGSPHVDGVLARRQAGSTLKPFLYGLALEKRYLTAASLLADTPVNLETANGLYIPQNYDRDFKGTVSVRTALAGSLNVPAVRTLALVGVERLRDRLHELGYRGLTQAGEYYGFALALGSADVSLWEQVNAYRTLANGGWYRPLRLRPQADTGPPRRILDEPAAFIVADILADRAGRAITFGLDNPLTTHYWSAVKTGTSKDLRDNWCLGFSRRYTVGVWVGNFEGEAMHDVSGITGAAPVWLEIMDALHAADRATSPAPVSPAGTVQRAVRFDPEIEPPREEWFLSGTEITTVALSDPQHRPPRIASPPNGVVIALDPDIPAANQAVVFVAKPPRDDTRFRLDGQELAPATARYKWQPQPGRHRLALVGADGKTYDSVDFMVRRVR